MRDVRVTEIMSTPVRAVPPNTPLREVAHELHDHHIGALVVGSDADPLQGLITATDFVRYVEDPAAATDTSVSEIMEDVVLTTGPSTPVSDVARSMLEHRIHHVPVVDGDSVVGILTSLDLTEYLAHQL